MNKVFKCPKCSNAFDKNARLPLTLPCGHVLCKECLLADKAHDRVKCSIDNSVFYASVKTLPPCQTIIEHLPINHMTEFVCKLHQDKHIKYYCSSCALSLCSKCICRHMSPHKLISFSPIKSSLLEEIEQIRESSVMKKAEIEIKEKELLNQLKQFSNRKGDNSNFLIETIEALISTLNQLKQSICSVCSSKAGLQKEEITKALLKTVKDKQMLISLQEQMSNYIQMINANRRIVFDDIDKEKKIVIQQWENVIKSSINDNLLNKKHKEEIVIQPANDRIALFKQLKTKMEAFDHLFYKCESNLEAPDALLQSHCSQKSSNNSTRDLTRKSLHRQFLYNSTKNISNISKALKMNNKSKCDESNQSAQLYTDNM